jgi:hypothetical protein
MITSNAWQNWSSLQINTQPRGLLTITRRNNSVLRPQSQLIRLEKPREPAFIHQLQGTSVLRRQSRVILLERPRVLAAMSLTANDQPSSLWNRLIRDQGYSHSHSAEPLVQPLLAQSYTLKFMNQAGVIQEEALKSDRCLRRALETGKGGHTVLRSIQEPSHTGFG